MPQKTIVRLLKSTLHFIEDSQRQDMTVILELAKSNLKAAIVLLEKGYDANDDDVETILDQYDTLKEIPYKQ